jgi:hypothetical protein
MDGWKRTNCCDFRRMNVNIIRLSGQPLKKYLGEQKSVFIFPI